MLNISYAKDISYQTIKYDPKENTNINGKIIINLNNSGPQINKSFYGSHLDSSNQIPSKELIDELQLGKLRIGGNEYDVFNWISKIALGNNEFKAINGFENVASTLKNDKVDGIFQINLTGYQPEVAGKGYAIHRSFTSKSAYQMVKHLNGDLHLNIVDFSLGNEFSIWHETHSTIWPTKDGISADEYIDRYIEYAIAIRQAQKEVTGDANSIKIWGPEISSSWLEWNTGNFSSDCEWSNVKGQVSCTYGNGKYNHFIPYFLKRLSQAEKNLTLNPHSYKLLDYFSFHYYPNFRTKLSDPLSVITNENGLQQVAKILESSRLLYDPNYVNKIDISSFINFSPKILSRLKTWIQDNYPGAKLALNEFAIDSDYRSTNYHPIIRPLYMADAIGIMASEGVSFYNQFILNSGVDEDVPWSMIGIDNKKKDLFYMYKLFTNNFLGQIIGVENNFDDVIKSYATLQNQNINLIIVNKEPIEKNVQIYIKSNKLKKISTYKIPGWSASVLKLNKDSYMKDNSIAVLQFGANEMGIPLDLNYSKHNQL
jgi:hypothetical protein